MDFGQGPSLLLLCLFKTSLEIAHVVYAENQSSAVAVVCEDARILARVHDTTKECQTDFAPLVLC